MSLDFSQPQRQSPAGIVIMLAYTLQRFIRAMIFPLVFVIIKSYKTWLLYYVFGFSVVVILALIYAYIYYIKFSFYLDPVKHEFVINKGVFARENLTIPLDKIQQVNINQSFLQKLVGVFSLQLDTAGSDSKEGKITAIDRQIAYALKEQLLGDQSITTNNLSDKNIDEKTVEAANIPIVKINSLTLLKVGLTSNYGRSIALLIGVAYAIYHNTKEFLKALDNDTGQIENFVKSGFNLISVTVILLVALAILLATNVIRTFIKYYNFKIGKHHQSLLISSGLINKKNTLLSPSRVQVASVTQNYFQRKIGLSNLTLIQAQAGNEQSDKEAKSSNLQVPGCNAVEKDEILRMILSKLPQKGDESKPNFRFLNLPILLYVLIPSLIFWFLYSYEGSVRPFLPLAILYVVVAIIMLFISYSNHRIFVNEDFIIKQNGIWDIQQKIIEPHKIQSISTSQFPWHKALDIGHLTLYTAAGSISFSYGNFTEIKMLVNYWLYQVESTNKDWM